MKIKHIVLSGGLYNGLYELGALQCLSLNKFYNINDIEKIYASSAGGIIAIMLCLKLDWEILVNYIIKKHWVEVFQINTSNIFSIYNKCGLFGKKIFKDMFYPLLKITNLSVNITLNEFFKYSNIELNLYATDLESFKLKNISHKTYPNMKLIKAIYITCCFPFLFKPALYKHTYFLDGGLINNFPVNKCLQDGAKKNEVLGIYLNKYNKKKYKLKKSNIIHLGFNIISQLIRKNKEIYKEIDYKVIIPIKEKSLITGINLIKFEENRKQFIEEGKKYAKIFLAYKTKKNLKVFL